MLYPIMNETRSLISLDGIWTVNINGDMREIAVPASWNEQYNDLFDYFGEVLYKKTVFVPNEFKNKNIWLRFGSVALRASVYINGTEVCCHEGASLPFECEISAFADCGAENEIEVKVDNTLDAWGLPPAVLEENEGRVGFKRSFPAVTYDFYPYGGIHRSVYMYSAPIIRIENIQIDTDISGNIKFRVKLSDSFTGQLAVETDSISQLLDIQNEDFISGEINIPNPRLWDIGTPELYTMKVSIIRETALVDTYTQTYGIRTVKIEDNHIVLNGKKVFLKGFGKHEDFYIIGKGISPAVVVKDFGLMNWIGANSFRTSHYPYDEQILDYADRHGVLVIGETPFVGLNERMYRPDILNKATNIIQKMIERDYNHPSIIMWSMANEPNVDTKEGEEFFKTMYDTAGSLDATRPITYVAHLEPENNLGMKYYDIICINKYYGWYAGPGQIDGTLQEFSDCMDRFHNAFNKGVIVTEFGADAIAGMHFEPPQMFSEEYQAEIIEKQYNVIKSKPYASGAQVWAFADFKTAQSVSRVLLNRKGVFTRDRQPKMAAHMLRKLWKTSNS